MGHEDQHVQPELEFIEPDDALSFYFRDVRPIPLLTQDQEVELAQRMARGNEAKETLAQIGEELDPQARARLEAEVRQGEDAFMALVQANFRLVIGIARKYTGREVPLPDLIQEGNLGLMHAVEKFDHRKGYKFSTYATWWIWQAVTRALADQGRTIRVPIHLKDRIRRLRRFAEELGKELERPPTPEELAEATGLSIDQVRLALEADRGVRSLEEPVSKTEESIQLGDRIEAQGAPDPAEEMERRLLSEDVTELLTALPTREARVLAMRYGLGGWREHTLKEIGERFDLTRERIRQIERDALRKLRHPRRTAQLRDYL